LLEQETETNFLWVPQQGLVFIRYNDVIYGGLGLILFMCTLDLWGSVALLGTVAYLILLGHFKMEPHKGAKYSKSLDPHKIKEVLMDEESDEELEDRDEVVEPRVQSSSSDDEDDAEETKVAFRATRAGYLSDFLNFTGSPKTQKIQEFSSSCLNYITKVFHSN
jgi:hypothetical protein